MKKPFARPLLESLEDRLCPALDFFYSPVTGDLTITGEIDDPLGLTIATDGAPGVLDVTVGITQVLDNFEITGGLRILLNSPGDDFISLDLSDGIFGNLEVDMGSQAIFGDILDINAMAGTALIGGNVRLTGANTITAVADVGGSVTINNSRTNFSNLVTAFGGSVGSNFSYFGGNDSDILPILAFIGGNLTARMGNGDLGDLDVVGVVGGNVTYTGGSGVDQVDIIGVVARNVTVNLGVDQIGLGNSFTLGGATIGSNLVVSGGIDVDQVTVTNGSTIGGNILLNLGDGLNDVSLEGAIGGRSVSILTGLDNDTVVYSMVGSNVRLFSSLSLGDDVFTLGDGFTNPTLSYLYIDFGFGSDTFTNLFMGAFTFPAYLRNLP